MGGLCWGIMRKPGIAGMPVAWQGRWLGWVWRSMFAALLIATAGAMLAADGEIAALLLPLHGAKALGLGATLLLGWWTSGRSGTFLANICKGVIFLLLTVLVGGLLLSPVEGAVLQEQHPAESIGLGICYGGFNMALAAPVIASTSEKLSRSEQKCCVIVFSVLTAILLLLGNAVLLRHPGLAGETLPFVVMMNSWGQAGYLLSAAALYLAAFTTLAACLKGLRLMLNSWSWAATAVVGLLSLGGMEAIVSTAYPVLGAGCFLLLTAALVQKL